MSGRGEVFDLEPAGALLGDIQGLGRRRPPNSATVSSTPAAWNFAVSASLELLVGDHRSG